MKGKWVEFGGMKSIDEGDLGFELFCSMIWLLTCFVLVSKVHNKGCVYQTVNEYNQKV